jgi:hypothetical protein
MRRRGRLSSRGEVITESADERSLNIHSSAFVRPVGLTENSPPFCQARLIRAIKHKNNGMTLVIVFLPNRTDRLLAAEVEESEGRRGEGYLTDCGVEMRVRGVMMGDCSWALGGGRLTVLAYCWAYPLGTQPRHIIIQTLHPLQKRLPHPISKQPPHPLNELTVFPAYEHHQQQQGSREGGAMLTLSNPMITILNSSFLVRYSWNPRKR